jgi:hypothetical protein
VKQIRIKAKIVYGEQSIASREREDKEYFSKDRIFEGERIDMEH